MPRGQDGSLGSLRFPRRAPAGLAQGALLPGLGHLVTARGNEGEHQSGETALRGTDRRGAVPGCCSGWPRPSPAARRSTSGGFGWLRCSTCSARAGSPRRPRHFWRNSSRRPAQDFCRPRRRRPFLRLRGCDIFGETRHGGPGHVGIVQPGLRHCWRNPSPGPVRGRLGSSCHAIARLRRRCDVSDKDAGTRTVGRVGRPRLASAPPGTLELPTGDSVPRRPQRGANARRVPRPSR